MANSDCDVKAVNDPFMDLAYSWLGHPATPLPRHPAPLGESGRHLVVNGKDVQIFHDSPDTAQNEDGQGKQAAMSWVAGVGAAITIKLSSSIDDVVWLAPFLTNNTSSSARMQNAFIYISVCLTQTCVAMAIAYSGDSLVSMLTKDAKNMWSTDKILTVIAGSLLALYAVKLTYEYVQERMQEASADGDGKEEEDPELEMDEPKVDEAKQTQTLFVIAFLGSVDDLTLFVPMLVGKGFDMVQLVVGGLIAATAIVMLCLFVGLCKPVADCLSKVPLVAIVVVFSVTLLFKACTMD